MTDKPNNPGPRHIAFIMDGNRRFAKRLMLEPTRGHEFGAEKLWSVYKWCKEAGVCEATFYAFSTENFNRPKKEFDYLMNLFEKETSKLLTDTRVAQESIRIKIIGRTYMFNETLQKLIAQVQEKTAGNNGFTMTFALAYGGRSELVDACKRLAEEVKNGALRVEDIDEKKLGERLYMDSEPDMIIRTGGEKRTSNFLPYQSVYSEWFFLDRFWPEFSEEDFKKCLGEFMSRERRIGK